ncbi:MAG: molybdenum cofactor biosynthesis F family protein [bacterium]
MSDTSRWISVGELAQAFGPDNNALTPTTDLAGKTVDLHLEDGRLITHRFETDSRLSWETAASGGATTGARETYSATKVREGIYFVDFIKHLDRATTVSLLLDMDRGIATALIGRLPDGAEAPRSLAERAAQGKELTAVSATFLSGAVNAPFSAETPRHTITDELVGRRVEYTYSPSERYEHIYLNEDFYTWQCLLGSEKGLADTDRCHYYKLAEELYFFVWREKIVPTLGAVVVDLGLMRTTGKIFGYRGGGFEESINFPVGASARLLNITRRH